MAGAIRRASVRQQPVARVAKQQVPLYHAHGCDQCGRRFMDSCARPLEPRSCVTCRLGQEPSVTDMNRLPRSCCVETSRLITDVDTLSKYGLAGHTPWFQCVGANGCYRTHPFDPTKDADAEAAP